MADSCVVLHKRPSQHTLTTVQSRIALEVSSTGVPLTGLGCVFRLARRSAPGVKGLLMTCRQSRQGTTGVMQQPGTCRQHLKTACRTVSCAICSVSAGAQGHTVLQASILPLPLSSGPLPANRSLRISTKRDHNSNCQHSADIKRQHQHCPLTFLTLLACDSATMLMAKGLPGISMVSRVRLFLMDTVTPGGSNEACKHHMTTHNAHSDNVTPRLRPSW